MVVTGPATPGDPTGPGPGVPPPIGVTPAACDTVMLTVAGLLLPPWPSVTPYVNWSTPWKPGAGRYVKAPVLLNRSRGPCVGGVTRAADSRSASASMSLARTPGALMARTGCSAEITTLKASFVATGASFTAVTVMKTVAVAVCPFGSAMSYVKASGPEKFAVGL